MRRLAVLFLAVIMAGVILCGCEEKPKTDTPSNHICIECGGTASHYMGKQWINYSTVDLYYCDLCYDKVIEEYEENNRIVHEIWWE